MNHAPARPLLALTGIVLAAHVLLLRAPQDEFRPTEPVFSRSLMMRTLNFEAPVAPSEPVVVRTPGPPRRSNMRNADPANAREPDAPPSNAGIPQPEPPVGESSTAVPVEATPMQAGTPPAAAFAIPGSATLHYQVNVRARGQDWQARGELVWRHDGESYDAKLELNIPLLPLRTQHSTGRITPEGLAPVRYSDKNRSEQAAHFERDKGKVTFSSNRPDAPLLVGAQDRLSVILQLASMIAGDPKKFPPATTITIPTAGTREAEPWIFTVEGDEELLLPGGKVAALKLIRNPREEFDPKIELWLAPSMDYVPVRVRLTQPNGDWADQQWSSTDRG